MSQESTCEERHNIRDTTKGHKTSTTPRKLRIPKGLPIVARAAAVGHIRCTSYKIKSRCCSELIKCLHSETARHCKTT